MIKIYCHISIDIWLVEGRFYSTNELAEEMGLQLSTIYLNRTKHAPWTINSRKSNKPK